MTKNLLKRSRLATAIALIPAVGFAENTVPFPNFPDPSDACYTFISRAINNIRANANLPPMAISKSDSNVSECIAKNQHGYDLAKYAWPNLSKKNAIMCRDMAAKIDTTWSYAQLGECASTYSVPTPQTFNKW